MKRFVGLLCAALLACSASPGWVAAAELPRRPSLGVDVVPHPAGGALVVAVPDGLAWPGESILVADRIVAIDGGAVSNPAAMTSRLRERANAAVSVQIERQGQTRTLAAQVVDHPREVAAGLEVRYDTLAMPRGPRRLVWVGPGEADGRARPAALIVGGLGCYPADQPFNPNEAQRALAHGLARAGWITLRVEKSGAGDSQGPPCAGEPMATEVEGLVAGLKWLKSQPQVDATRVVIVGISMGGIVAPRVAAQEPVAGIAAFEIVGGTSWFEYELENRRRQLALRGLDAAAIDDAARLRADCMARLYLSGQPREGVLKAVPGCERELRYPVGDAYMSDVFRANLVRDWLATSVPVLLVYGSADFITSAAQHAGLRDAINASKPGRARFVEVPGMDHWLSRADTQAASFDRAVNRGRFIDRFHDGALTTLLQWFATLERR